MAIITSAAFQPCALVSIVMQSPSQPDTALSWLHMPISLYLCSLGQSLVGHLYCMSLTSTKPASIKTFFSSFMSLAGRPNFSDAS
ncbi:hypothetical protein ColKHC_13142 [Colletotrichum higginsianum]|nr:hypothetical protein ColKHC_13142 [Colletotrichum higginsianum]